MIHQNGKFARKEDQAINDIVPRFQRTVGRKAVIERLQLIDVPVMDIQELFGLLDDDGGGEITIDE